MRFFGFVIRIYGDGKLTNFAALFCAILVTDSLTVNPGIHAL